MQLNITTDYAIRIVLCLAMRGGMAASREIAETMAIPHDYVLKTVRKLTAAGLVRTSVGPRGGVVLAKAPEDVSLLDLIQAVESTTRLNRCLEEDAYCSRFATENCPVRRVYTVLQSELEQKLSAITVKALLDDPAEETNEKGM